MGEVQMKKEETMSKKYTMRECINVLKEVLKFRYVTNDVARCLRKIKSFLEEQYTHEQNILNYGTDEPDGQQAELGGLDQPVGESASSRIVMVNRIIKAINKFPEDIQQEFYNMFAKKAEPQPEGDDDRDDEAELIQMEMDRENEK